MFLDRAFWSGSCAIFASEIHFGREKPEHANAPILDTIRDAYIRTNTSFNSTRLLMPDQQGNDMAGTYLSPTIGLALQIAHFTWCLQLSDVAKRWNTGSHTIDCGSILNQSINWRLSTDVLLLAYITNEDTWVWTQRWTVRGWKVYEGYGQSDA